MKVQVSELVFACHSAACRPPTSGGTGGSRSSGSSGGAGRGGKTAEGTWKVGDYTITKAKKGYSVQGPNFKATAKTLSLAKKRIKREDSLSPNGWNGDDRLATKKTDHLNAETVGSHLRIKDKTGRMIHDKKYGSVTEAWKAAEEKMPQFEKVERGRARAAAGPVTSTPASPSKNPGTPGYKPRQMSKSQAENEIDNIVRDSENDGYYPDQRDAGKWLRGFKEMRRTGKPVEVPGDSWYGPSGREIKAPVDIIQPGDTRWHTKLDYEVSFPADTVAAWLGEPLDD